MTDSAEVARRTRRRDAQLAERLAELRTRRDQLLQSPLRGSTMEQALRAAELAAQAHRQAGRAYENVIKAHLSAAAVHEEAVRLYEALLASGTGDLERYRRRAAEHRQGAAWEHAEARRIQELRDSLDDAFTDG